MARIARVMGDVEIAIKIRKDGGVESAAVAMSASPLLNEAALNSARQSQFDCDRCTPVKAVYRVLYTFKLGATEPCGSAIANSGNAKELEPFPKVTHEGNHVVLVDWALSSCDPVGELHFRVRSAKCLYLWKCGDRIK